MCFQRMVGSNSISYLNVQSGFLHELKQICVNNSILFIADEVQTGFGRTGGMFSFSHFNLLPDIVVFAKGLANGFPLSGVVSSRSLMDKQPPGSMVRVNTSFILFLRITRVERMLVMLLLVPLPVRLSMCLSMRTCWTMLLFGEANHSLTFLTMKTSIVGMKHALL